MTRKCNGDRRRGFTLIELMVVVALFSIVTTIAVGAYRGYIQRVNRTDATQLLLRVSAAQERYYLEQNQYALQGDLVDLGFDTGKSENGYYNLTIAVGPSGNRAIDYIAIADVVGGSGQADDAACQQFIIDVRGVRNSQPEPPETCWR
ncbi:MAG: type IV pilin protein [Gammaproteobacteria bacterium]